MFNKILVLLAIIALSYSHSTHYKVDRNKTCYDPTPAKIYSWHIHLLFWTNGNSENVKNAMKVRDAFIGQFKSKLYNETCKDLFHQDYNCMFEIDHEAVGPFLTAQWSVFLLPEYVGEFLPWIMQNRGINDILLHPNTGCEVEDHSWWAMWGGTPWQIDLSAFSHDQPFPWPDQKENQQQAIEQSPLVKKFLEEHEM